MENNWAAEHLQTIRTLMERAAVYRRALAPVMTFAGIIGFFAALIGWFFQISSPTGFVVYWFCMGAITLTGAFLMVRRQAWQHSEPFWSPPTRRVALAMLPPLAVGFFLGVFVIIADNWPTEVDPPTGGFPPAWIVVVGLPLAWGILYGCALHSAGFFMPRGMRLFAWIIIIGCCGVIAFGRAETPRAIINFGYGVMGFFFGVAHLAYGTYLSLTEQGKNAA